MLKLAICTVNWNGKQDTLEFLISLNKLETKGLEAKVFIVDGGSTDDSLSELKILKPKVKIPLEIIEKKENRGSAGGYNDGAREGLKWGADYVLLINNDTVIKDKNLIKDLVKTIESDPSIGLVTPKIYFAPGFEFQPGQNTSKNKGNILWYAGGTVDWQNIGSHHRGIDEIDVGKYDEVSETDFTNGACVLVRREVYDKGIFWDEELFAYMDDNDFQEKVKKAGYRLYYDGLTSLYHKVSRTSGIGSPVSDYYLSRNRLVFGFKYANLRTKFALLREAIKILFSGRKMQKKGVQDFFLGKRGALKVPNVQ